MTAKLLQQVRLIDPVSQTDRTADVLIQAGQVQAIEAQISPLPEMQVQDCRGWVLAPGLVDLYSHSGEPGFEDRETLESLLKAAAAGGFTRLTLLPNTQPAVDHPTSVEWVRSQVGRYAPAALSQVNLWGALTLGAKGEQMVELGELAATQVVGFTDGQPLQNTALLRRILEYGQFLGKPIGLCCWDRGIAGNGVAREGQESIRLGLPGDPALSETAALALVLECVAAIGTPVHLMRISTARGVELVQAAKAQGLPITASTSWMHLLLDATDLASYDPSLHLAPPLGNPGDRIALIQGLQAGILDAIAIDHSPYTYEEKTVSFAEAPPGAIGLELALPLLWQTFVATGQWSALDLWRFLSSQPAQCLHQAPATLTPGSRAELVLFDPQRSWQVSSKTLQSRSTNTPWLGQDLRGQVVETWVGAWD